jgi:hypothetical protein
MKPVFITLTIFVLTLGLVCASDYQKELDDMMYDMNEILEPDDDYKEPTNTDSQALSDQNQRYALYKLFNS